MKQKVNRRNFLNMRRLVINELPICPSEYGKLSQTKISQMKRRKEASIYFEISSPVFEVIFWRTKHKKKFSKFLNSENLNKIFIGKTFEFL